ncbi:type II toxin-antitoxin system RelE family toxin [Streptomyces specialis]|uniref:type II toxin-antitoxin system RelE family toxin n=1 Tax=Streptomyces specialis TaxID=498367 RepID=UPI00099F3533|nr:type II toxin-antitoxin system RelE/ParE family toxin [Streptomyces specialis]
MSRVTWSSGAKRSLAKYQKDDPGGVDHVLDAVNLLRKNPRPPGAQPYGSDHLRIHVGRYRVLYRIVSNEPLIVGIETVGRVPKP